MSNIYIYIYRNYSLFFYIMHIFYLRQMCENNSDIVQYKQKKKEPKQFCVKVSFYYVNYTKCIRIYVYTCFDSHSDFLLSHCQQNKITVLE